MSSSEVSSEELLLRRVLEEVERDSEEASEGSGDASARCREGSDLKWKETAPCVLTTSVSTSANTCPETDSSSCRSQMSSSKADSPSPLLDCLIMLPTRFHSSLSFWWRSAPPR